MPADALKVRERSGTAEVFCPIHRPPYCVAGPRADDPLSAKPSRGLRPPRRAYRAAGAVGLRTARRQPGGDPHRPLGSVGARPAGHCARAEGPRRRAAGHRAAGSPIVRSVSASVRRTLPSVSDNVRRKHRIHCASRRSSLRAATHSYGHLPASTRPKGDAALRGPCHGAALAFRAHPT
jgi:hypothetical protein